MAPGPTTAAVLPTVPGTLAGTVPVGAPPARDLTRAECLAFLAHAPFGRLVSVANGLPVVLPVAFLLDPAGIVLRTSARGAAAATAGGTVAFQADAVDVDRRTGWSVTVVGPARLVTDRVERARLGALPLQPWVAGTRDTLVVVGVGLVTGRRVGGAEPLHPAES